MIVSDAIYVFYAKKIKYALFSDHTLLAFINKKITCGILYCILKHIFIYCLSFRDSHETNYDTAVSVTNNFIKIKFG